MHVAFNRAVLERDDALESGADRWIVRDDDDGFASVCQLPEQVLDDASGLAIKVASGFIGHHDWGVVRQGAGDGRTLLLATGQGRRQLVGMLADADLVQQLLGAKLALVLRDDFDEIHRQQHVFENGQRRNQLEELEHDADVLAAPACQRTLVERVDINAVDHHRALARVIDACEHIEQGRFAAAGLADDRDVLAGAKAQVNVFERRETGARTGVGFADSA